MRARIYQVEDDQWLIADDDEKYVEGPFIEIPDEVGQPMRAAQEQWSVVSKALAEWVDGQIETNGEDYRDYLTGQITESQWEARRAGCAHANVTNEGTDKWPRTECVDCGRRHYREKWL